MTHDSTKFNLSLEPDFDEFDPLEDLEEDAEEGQADEFVATVSPAEGALARDVAEAPAAAAVDERPAEERIAELLAAMAPRRKVLLGILAFCEEPQPVADVNAHVDELQENNFSVYTAANLCTLLERAGALARVTPDGEPAEDIEAEPEVVVVDGVEYLEAREPVQICWVVTEAGRDALEADKPLDRLRTLLEDDAAYQAIYKRILTLCTAEGGAKTPDINAAVDHDPLVQKPRFYAPHFIDKLEKCDALTWKKAWMTTEIGQAGLKMLADVIDEPAPASADEKE